MTDIEDTLGLKGIEDKDIYKTIEGLTNFENIAAKTDLTPNQVVVISRAIWFAEKYHIPTLNQFVTQYLRHLISKDRKGRLELVASITSALELEKQKDALREVKI